MRTSYGKFTLSVSARSGLFPASDPEDWASPAPMTIDGAIDRLAHAIHSLYYPVPFLPESPGGTYTAGTPEHWAGSPPASITTALDRLANAVNTLFFPVP